MSRMSHFADRIVLHERFVICLFPVFLILGSHVATWLHSNQVPQLFADWPAASSPARCIYAPNGEPRRFTTSTSRLHFFSPAAQCTPSRRVSQPGLGLSSADPVTSYFLSTFRLLPPAPHLNYITAQYKE